MGILSGFLNACEIKQKRVKRIRMAPVVSVLTSPNTAQFLVNFTRIFFFIVIVECSYSNTVIMYSINMPI